jgi:hypothetical protein
MLPLPTLRHAPTLQSAQILQCFGVEVSLSLISRPAPR